MCYLRITDDRVAENLSSSNKTRSLCRIFPSPRRSAVLLPQGAGGTWYGCLGELLGVACVGSSFTWSVADGEEAEDKDRDLLSICCGCSALSRRSSSVCTRSERTVTSRLRPSTCLVNVSALRWIQPERRTDRGLYTASRTERPEVAR